VADYTPSNDLVVASVFDTQLGHKYDRVEYPRVFQMEVVGSRIHRARMQVVLAVDDLDRSDALAECNFYPGMGVDDSRPAVDNHHVAGNHLNVDDYPAINPFYPSQEGRPTARRTGPEVRAGPEYCVLRLVVLREDTLVCVEDRERSDAGAP